MLNKKYKCLSDDRIYVLVEEIVKKKLVQTLQCIDCKTKNKKITLIEGQLELMLKFNTMKEIE